MEKAEEELRDYAAQLAGQGLTEKEIFQYLLLEFCGTPYTWGESTTEGSDCSGTVCACLNALYGSTKRITADMLYRTCFTKEPVNGEGIQAVFFLTKEKKAVHVCGSAGYGDYLNESSYEQHSCGTLRTLAQLKQMYSWLTPVVRMLDTEAWK